MEDGKKKLELLRQNIGYRFSKDLQKVENNYNVRQVTPDYMDHIAASEIPLSDCYILEGALFFRRATARLVSMYIAYYRSYYNPDLDKEIKCIPVSSESVFSFEEDDKAYLKNIETRLRYLTRKSLLYSSKYTVSIFGGGVKEINVYYASYHTFSFLTSLFGTRNEIGMENSPYRYHSPYINALPHVVMKEMNACYVGMLAFLNYPLPVKIRREESIAYGVNRLNRYQPTMLAHLESGGYAWDIGVEAIHFEFDDNLVYEKRYMETIENQIMIMSEVVKHYNYMQSRQDKKQRIRFLIVCENLKGILRAAKMMEKYRNEMSERVFFTTAKTIQVFREDLLQALVMAKKRVIDGEEHLSIVEPTLTKNQWLSPNSQANEQ